MDGRGGGERGSTRMIKSDSPDRRPSRARTGLPCHKSSRMLCACLYRRYTSSRLYVAQVQNTISEFSKSIPPLPFLTPTKILYTCIIYIYIFKYLHTYYVSVYLYIYRFLYRCICCIFHSSIQNSMCDDCKWLIRTGRHLILVL